MYGAGMENVIAVSYTHLDGYKRQPDAFKQAMECEEDDVYIITLSSHLSGSYNSAVIGKELYEDCLLYSSILQQWTRLQGRLERQL